MKQEEYIEPTFKPVEGEFIFVYCKNDDVMNKLFNYYRQNPKITCIDKISGHDIDMGVKPGLAMPHMCNVIGVETYRAEAEMYRFGFEDALKAPHDEETYRLLYLAVSIARDNDVIVVKDFVRGQSREFQEKFLDLMASQVDVEKSIIYLSTQFYQQKDLGKLAPKLKDMPYLVPPSVNSIRSIDLR